MQTTSSFTRYCRNKVQENLNDVCIHMKFDIVLTKNITDRGHVHGERTGTYYRALRHAEVERVSIWTSSSNVDTIYPASEIRRNQFRAVHMMPYLDWNLLSMMSWSSVSNAADKSSSTRKTAFPLSIQLHEGCNFEQIKEQSPCCTGLYRQTGGVQINWIFVYTR